MIGKGFTYAALAAALALCSQAYGGVVTLTVSPANGVVAGEPGSTVGWGFDIVNNTGDDLVLDNSYFCESGEDPVSGPDFSCAANSAVGTYTDYIADNLGIIAPGETVEAFDGATQGFGQYAINPAATVPSTDSGTLVLLYDVYTTDLQTEIASSQELTASVSVSATPEPASSALLGGALLLTAAYVIRRRRLA